ncbi:OmpH family outer membrane protein [bacterium]|nr:OmpH family outer membrane protein [bacterium]
MKKQGIITLSILTFALGFGINQFANSNAIPATVAVVDVNSVVSSSSQVQALKKEQKAKMVELEKWLKSVKADVDKQQTQEGKEKLVKKYDAEFTKKKQEISKNYKEKLSAIDKSISQAIAQEAQSQGYNLVIAKNVVLYGGSDITASVKKAVK